MSDRRAAEKAEGYRSPPNNLEAEQALLGALFVNNEAIHLVATFLEPEHFFLPIRGRIYAAVMHMIGEVAPEDRAGGILDTSLPSCSRSQIHHLYLSRARHRRENQPSNHPKWKYGS